MQFAILHRPTRSSPNPNLLGTETAPPEACFESSWLDEMTTQIRLGATQIRVNNKISRVHLRDSNVWTVVSAKPIYSNHRCLKRCPDLQGKTTVVVQVRSLRKRPLEGHTATCRTLDLRDGYIKSKTTTGQGIH